MSEDKSMSQPGATGWGLKKQTAEERFDIEKAAYDRLLMSRPHQLLRQPMREINPRILDRMRAVMLEDGIEDGFSGLHMEKTIFGSFFPWKAQIIGSCVASGGMRVMTRRSMVEAFLLNEPEDIFGTKIIGTDNVAHFAPYSYRAGRNKARINGNSDGSFCSAHINGAMDYGMIPCSTPGLASDAFPEPQNSRTYKQWGANDTLMNQFMTTGRRFKLLESEKVTSLSQLLSALRDHFKPMMICSMWAFKPKAKHPTWKLADGSSVWIYTRNRATSWAHNMSVDGAWLHNGKWYICIDNSWGANAHNNGSWFIIEPDEMDAWIRSAEIYTIGDMDLQDVGGPI